MTAQFHTCGIFYDSVRRTVLLQMRDSRAPVSPDEWCLFGGLSEPGETPSQCFAREVHEELGVQVDEHELGDVRPFIHPRTGRPGYLFVVTRYLPPDEIVLGEGADFAWFEIGGWEHLRVTALTHELLAEFIKGLTKTSPSGGTGKGRP